MGKTFRKYYEHIRIPVAPPTKVMQSRVEILRASNYLLDSSYYDEEVTDEDMQPFWAGEEEPESAEETR